MATALPACPVCSSNLVVRIDTTKTSYENADAECRICGEKISADSLIETSLKEHFAGESYSAAQDGDLGPLQECPDCFNETYVTWEGEHGCVWCRLELGKCFRCEVGLSPENVSSENSTLCSYCENLMSKDD